MAYRVKSTRKRSSAFPDFSSCTCPGNIPSTGLLQPKEAKYGASWLEQQSEGQAGSCCPAPAPFPHSSQLTGHRPACCHWYLDSRPPCADDTEPEAAENHSLKIRAGSRQTQLGISRDTLEAGMGTHPVTP